MTMKVGLLGWITAQVEAPRYGIVLETTQTETYVGNETRTGSECKLKVCEVTELGLSP